ncbi:putative F-box/FBD/LRR-repeat protein [Arabidopsis thaliana]
MSKKRGVTGQDRISLLPDHLLCRILSDLPTKIAVRTSVLSKRWKRFSLSVPFLEFNVSEFHGYYEFARVVHGFLDTSRETCIHKLKLAFEKKQHDRSYLTQWIHNAVMRKVQHLDIGRWSYLGQELIPHSLYTCETLVSLRLHNVSLPDFDHVSLPRLKTMHLIDNIYPNDALLENLITSCPVLEDLNVSRDVENIVKVLRVRSLSLKSLILALDGDRYRDIEDDGWEVVIDAPRLSYLSLRDDQSKSFVLSSVTSPAKVDIDVTFDVVRSVLKNFLLTRSVVRNFFTRLSNVRDMTMSGTTLKVLSRYMKHEPLPQFPCMIQFYAVFCNSDLEKLPNFLESCPNLKSLVLELEEFKKNDLLILSSSIPKCLRSSLEYVEIHTPISGAEAEMRLVKYFLENAAVLKKFTLQLGCKRMDEESIIFKELLRFRRCSASCEVVVEV